jgi:peptide/nickel transport system substrate-binding protein
MKQLVRLLVLSLALVMAFATVGGAAAQDESVLVIGVEQEPPNLWPLNTLVFGGLPESLYGRDLWEWDKDRQIFPVMAEEIPTFENGMVVTTADGDTAVTITLREGILWSDGTPITTHDCEVWHSIRMDPATSDSVGRGAYPDLVKSFEVVDDRTFTITYTGTFPDYLSVAEQPECKYPAHVFEPAIADGGKLENDPYFTSAPTVGYGPYVMVEWNIGENMIFEPNPNWDGDAPGFSRIVWQFITDSSQMQNALEAGEVDLTFNWSDNLQPSYGEIESVETFFAPAVFADALWVRTGPNGNSDEHGGTALEDVRVRQAIAMAMDRNLWVEELVGPGVPVPKSWYPPTLWPEDLPFVEYDPEGAIALLAEAGWTDTNGDGTVDKDGIELAGLRLVSTENELRNNYQLVIQEALAAVGIGSEVQIIPATNLFASFADRGTLTNYEWDLAIFANSSQPLNPTSDADSYYCAGIPSAENPDGFNPWQFCNPRYDEVDGLIASTNPGPERDALVQEAVTLFYEHQFWHGLRLRVTWFAADSSVVDPASIEASVGTLSADWFNQIELWEPAG